MMAVHNISPETVLCGCCENHRVPEVGYTICEKRKESFPRHSAYIGKKRHGLRNGERAKVRSSEFGVGVKKEDREDCGTTSPHPLPTGERERVGGDCGMNREIQMIVKRNEE